MSTKLISSIYSMASEAPKQRGIWHCKETKEQMQIARGIKSKHGIGKAAEYLASKGWKLEAARFALL